MKKAMLLASVLLLGLAAAINLEWTAEPVLTYAASHAWAQYALIVIPALPLVGAMLGAHNN
jgi:hypothetical protein